MSILIRPARERGHADHGWLDSRHTFSFAGYHDPRHMGFGPLRVINEDRVAPGKGFETHGHRDMEIVSYVLEGALEHRDSIGTGSVIRPGEIQVMSAGSGIRHSEFNHSKTEPVHFLQIWIMPEANNLTPRYDQKSFPRPEISGRLRLVGSRDQRDGSVLVHQDASLYASVLNAGEQAPYAIAAGRKAWIQVAAGEIAVNGARAQSGDGLAIENETALTIIAATDNSEFLLFDLP